MSTLLPTVWWSVSGNVSLEVMEGSDGNSQLITGMYYVEYTIQKPGEAMRHLLSVVGIASNGWINRLYTVTGQVRSV